MTRVGAIDCGTNSLRLLVTDLDAASGAANEVDRRTTIVRLGQDVDRTGVFADEALERTFGCLDDYASVVARLGVERVRFVATSAARDVANRDSFVSGVRRRVGVAPDIVGGAEEARLSYDGATRELRGRDDVPGPLGVVDIGGGSTELVTVAAGSSTVVGESLDIGSVRLTERHLRHDPPTRGEVQAGREAIEVALRRAPTGWSDVATLVGVAGTVTTIAAMVLGLSHYDRDRTHQATLATSDVLEAVDRLVAMPVAERAGLGFMAPGRADVIGGGALILSGVVRRCGLQTLLVSEHDILDGIAWSVL